MSVPRQQNENTSSDRPVYDMAMPFDPNALKRNAQTSGLDRHDAAVFAHLALQELRGLHDKSDGEPVTALQVAEAIKKYAAEEVVREKDREKQRERNQLKSDMAKESLDLMDFSLDCGGILDGFYDIEESFPGIELQNGDIDGSRKKFKFDDDALSKYFANTDPYSLANNMDSLSLKYNGRDIITAICGHVELAVELGKHLRPRDVVSLYIANRCFKSAVDGYLLSSIRKWISYNAPEAGRIFSFKLYRRHLVPDPAGRSWVDCGEDAKKHGYHRRVTETRTIPGLKYLQLVLGRDRYCREIVAIMARNGHRMPDTMRKTLLRMWLLMDVPTSAQREALLRNKQLWTDYDLYNAQFFFIKLGMYFNDPIYGPGTYEMVQLMLGQRGLYPLWQLLLRKKYTKLPELVELQMRYSFEVPPDHWGHDYFDTGVHGVPFDDVGIGHLEGWGMGKKHLLRPDEVVPIEAVTRGLELDKHLTHMMLWGYFDWETGDNAVPTEEEMYISDEENVISDMDTTHHWKPKHAMKKRFSTLTPQQQADILEDDEDERLRAMAWCGEIDDYPSDEDADEDAPPSLDDELRRGFVMPSQPKDHKSKVPSMEDNEGWEDFVNYSLMGLPPDVSEDERLRVQAWQSYQTVEYGENWDWERWLEQPGPPGGDADVDEDADVCVDYGSAGSADSGVTYVDEDIGYEPDIDEDDDENEYQGEHGVDESVVEDESDDEQGAEVEHELKDEEEGLFSDEEDQDMVDAE